jgi:hypothetical protein
VSDESFDELDRALAHGLSALAPEVDGGDETLARLRPRFRRARTRRRAAGIGVSLVALVAIGSVALLAAPDSERAHVQVSGSPSTRGHSITSRSPTSVSTTTGPDSSPPPSSPTTSGHSSGPSGSSNLSNPSGGASPSPGTVPGTVPNGDHGGPGPSGGGSGGENSHGGSGPQSTTVPPTSEVQTYRSAGGTVTVRFAHGQLQLLGESAATGYQASIGSDQPDDIDVRFDGAQGQWRIRVRVDHDGHLTHEVTQG